MKWHPPRLACILACLALLTSTFEVSAEWWNEPEKGGPLEQRHADQARHVVSRIKWPEGIIEVWATATVDPREAINKAHERTLALEAARQLAYGELVKAVEGLHIDGVTIVRDAVVQDARVRATVRAQIRGAKVVHETTSERQDGSIWAEIILALPLYGPSGFVESLTKWSATRPLESYRPRPAFEILEPYTGLLVDASGIGFSPAVTPRLMFEGDQRLIYGPQIAQLSAVVQKGLIGYAPSLTEAKRSGRVGSNPLLVRAVGVSGQHTGDLLIARGDAERILAADRQSGFLANANVSIVLGIGPHEYAEGEGRRYALVIGVNAPRSPQNGPNLTSLAYAAKDAEALARLLLAKGGFSPGTVKILKNEEASREAIFANLRQELRNVVREEDTVVIFFSGHGTTGPGKDGDTHYYLLPADANLEALDETGLRDEAFEELIGQLAAKRVVVFLDACFSGGMVTRGRVKGLTNRRVTTKPVHQAFVEAVEGRVIISASRPDQASFEDAAKEQGVFTFFLLEALAGRADFDKSGAVTVLEAYQYLSEKVKAYTREAFELEQSPFLEVRGLSGEIALTGRLGSKSDLRSKASRGR